MSIYKFLLQYELLDYRNTPLNFLLHKQRYGSIDVLFKLIHLFLLQKSHLVGTTAYLIRGKCTVVLVLLL